MQLQLALDQIGLSEMIEVVAEVHDVVDIVEIGTPLIIKEGLAAVTAIKERFPRITVLADVKILDGGSYEARISFEAGADIVSVLAHAHDVTLTAAVREAEKYNGSIMVDLLGVEDVTGAIVRVERIGADTVCVHTASDLNGLVADTLAGLVKAVTAVQTCQVAVAGGITLQTVDEIMSKKPEIVIVGGGIMKKTNRREAALRFRRRIDQADRGGV